MRISSESDFRVRLPAALIQEPGRGRAGPGRPGGPRRAARISLHKRAFDVVFSLLLGALLLPLLLTLMAMIWLREGKPVFHAALRVKAPGQTFRMWKLRSMCVDCDDTGICGGHKADQITPLGRWLRRHRLDEIPQLWNILKGDMSFVGPRPPEPQYVARFPELYDQVLHCRPGVTGLATVVYHKHEERLLAPCVSAAQADRIYTQVCIPRKARLDLVYRDNVGLWLDVWLILRTLLGRRVPATLRPRALRRRGADSMAPGTALSGSARPVPLLRPVCAPAERGTERGAGHDELMLPMARLSR